MFRLVKMELKRLKYSKAFYVTILGFIIVVAMGISGLGDIKGKDSYSLFDVLNQFSSGYIFLAIFLNIFIGAYIQLDFKCGQIKNVVSATKDKGEFASIKFATIAVFFFIAQLLSVVLIGIVAIIKGGLAPENLVSELLGFVELYTMYLCLFSVLMFFAIVFHKGLVCTILGIFIGIVYPVMLPFLGNKIGLPIDKYSVLCNLFGAEMTAPVSTKIRLIISAVVLTVVVNTISKIVLRKRDIRV